MTLLKYRIHDIVCMNIQGVMTTGIIVKILILGSDILYELDIDATVREDQVIKLLGNAELIQEEYYVK